MSYLKVMHLLVAVIAANYCVECRSASRLKNNHTPAVGDNTDSQPDLKGKDPNQMQEWVMSKLGATEDRLNRKIHDIHGKIRRVNRTVDIAHLEGVYYYVSEELVLSEERDAARDSTVKSLESTITEQRKEIHHLKKRLGHLEETLINLTKRLDTGSHFSTAATTATPTEKSSASTSHVLGEILGSSPPPAIDKNTVASTLKPLPRGKYKILVFAISYFLALI